MYEATNETIQQSFFQLLKEKPLDSITVRDITDQGNLSRNSFYYHYRNISELLQTVLTDKSQTIIYPELNTDSALCELILKGVSAALVSEEIASNILNSGYRLQVIEYIVMISKETVLKYIELCSEVIHGQSQDMEILANFYASAFSRAIIEALSDPAKEGVDETIRRLDYLIEGSVQQAMLRSAIAQKKKETGLIS